MLDVFDGKDLYVYTAYLIGVIDNANIDRAAVRKAVEIHNKPIKE